ncbi:hypothetical protein A6J80_23065 (plasmid) [Paracoccus yeei]|uniref:Uncharacterized protein n=1 Tax=Paracoccus yeei TaxID=147645 RepID=A0A1V0GZA9_9RHOB|nr:hypothetical protein A6J80_23065 [Paracoccus yeei]
MRLWGATDAVLMYACTANLRSKLGMVRHPASCAARAIMWSAYTVPPVEIDRQSYLVGCLYH